jgi:hypothetical protein
MKHIAFAVALVVLLFGVAIFAQIQTESVEQELIRLENEWAEAWAKGDVAFFERIEADDYTWTSPSGEVWAKAQDLALVKSIKSVKSREAVITA